MDALLASALLLCFTFNLYISCFMAVWGWLHERLTGFPAGIFFGRTPLIKLSPKKTWEGFFGGLLITVLAAWVLAEYMSRFKWMVCERTVRRIELAQAAHHAAFCSF